MVVLEESTERKNESKSSTWTKNKNSNTMTSLRESMTLTLQMLTLKSSIISIPLTNIQFILMKMENTPKYPKSHQPIANYLKWSTQICGISLRMMNWPRKLNRLQHYQNPMSINRRKFTTLNKWEKSRTYPIPKVKRSKFIKNKSVDLTKWATEFQSHLQWPNKSTTTTVMSTLSFRN